jgi:general secretion pathway protein D
MHDKIAELVKMLDKRVPQVFLQAALVSIAYDTDLSIVTELSTVERTTSGDKGFGVTDFGLSKLTPVPGFILQGRADFRKGGLTFGITHGNANIIPVLVRISKTDSRVNVISMPSVMADNDQKAEFSTQDSAPVTQRTTQSDGSISDTFGAYQTAAIKIAITPTILKGERLRLDVTLLVEAFTDTQASPQVPPPKTSNSFTGIITVPDQKTIVVGGLVSERDSLVESKVPILGDIPILGLLFKSKTKIKAKGVLYVFITPRILRSQDTSDDDTLTKEKQDEIDKAKEKAGFGAKK